MVETLDEKGILVVTGKSSVEVVGFVVHEEILDVE